MFTEQEQPIISPTESAECTLNNQALFDVWNWIRCLSSKNVYTDKKCYYFWNGSTELDTFQIPKADIPNEPTKCEVAVYIINNTTHVRKEFKFHEDLDGVTIEWAWDDTDPDNWIVMLSTPATVEETVIIEVLKRESILDMIQCADL